MPCIEDRLKNVMMLRLADSIVGSVVGRIRATAIAIMVMIIHLILQLGYHNILPFYVAFVNDGTRRVILWRNIVVMVVCLNYEWNEVYI